jgi:hypothetical protein
VLDGGDLGPELKILGSRLPVLKDGEPGLKLVVLGEPLPPDPCTPPHHHSQHPRHRLDQGQQQRGNRRPKSIIHLDCAALITG